MEERVNIRHWEGMMMDARRCNGVLSLLSGTVRFVYLSLPRSRFQSVVRLENLTPR